MAYRSFLEQILEQILAPLTESMFEADDKESIIDGKLASKFHGLVVDLIDPALAEAFAESDVADEYTALVGNLKELHTAVCPDEELIFPGETDPDEDEDSDDGGEDEDEGGDELKELLEADGPQDISEIVEFFPKGAAKAARALANRGDLKFSGMDLDYSRVGGFESDQLEHLVDGREFDHWAFIEYSNDDNDYNVEIQTEVVIDSVHDVLYGAYEPHSDTMSFIALVNGLSEDFYHHAEREFTNETGEFFDEENPKHAKFAGRIAELQDTPVLAFISVDRDGHVSVEETTEDQLNQLKRRAPEGIEK